MNEVNLIEERMNLKKQPHFKLLYFFKPYTTNLIITDLGNCSFYILFNYLLELMANLE